MFFLSSMGAADFTYCGLFVDCAQVIDPQKRDPYEEIEILMRYDHPNIVKLRDVCHFFVNQSINQYYIIVRPKVDQRAGELCLLHLGITKTEKNTTKT